LGFVGLVVGGNLPQSTFRLSETLHPNMRGDTETTVSMRLEDRLSRPPP
jgi:hypothetical protein